MCLSDLFPLPLGSGGDERDRTDDPLLAKQVLSQLSYTPIDGMVGLSGLEPPTLRLSVVRSSQLSYGPMRRYSLGGDSRDRTGDLLLARQALSQLSYIPSYPLRRMPSKLNNVRQKRTDLRKSVGMVTNMSP